MAMNITYFFWHYQVILSTNLMCMWQWSGKSRAQS